jgi:predicted phosphohydrolase
MSAATVRLAWATDIHLDHADPDRIMAFFQALNECSCDRVLLGGDLTNARSLAVDLATMSEVVTAPIHFVLGNHDYYGGSISRVREVARGLGSSGLHWLPAEGCVELAPGVGLVGIGGWGDARNGNHESSPVMLTDYFVISDLVEVYDTENGDMTFASQPALKERLRALGRDAAAALRPHLHEAAGRFTQVVVLTHVPPFPEAAWHEGAHSSDDWLPGFSCGALGDELLVAANKHPDTVFTVLCGHTHGEGSAEVRPNLVVHTQGAEYGAPGFRIISAGKNGVVTFRVNDDSGRLGPG